VNEYVSSEDTTNGRAYGTHLAECVGVSTPVVPVHRSLRRGMLAVSELRSFIRASEPNASIGYDDAYLIAVQLRSFRREFWLNGQSVPCDPVQAGMSYIYDLRQDPRALVHDAGHALTFYMPRKSLEVLTEQNDLPAFFDLVRADTVGRNDRVMYHLAQAASAAFATPHSTSGLLLDELLVASCTHALGAFSNAQGSARRKVSGLAPWQDRRAKEMIDADLNVSLSELAQACELSISQFGRAFKRSTGTSPHQWQLARRIEKAQVLLTRSTLAISEVAFICGFSSQSHLNRAFRENTGTSPNQWRRMFSSRSDNR